MEVGEAMISFNPMHVYSCKSAWDCSLTAQSYLLACRQIAYSSSRSENMLVEVATHQRVLQGLQPNGWWLCMQASEETTIHWCRWVGGGGVWGMTAFWARMGRNLRKERARGVDLVAMVRGLFCTFAHLVYLSLEEGDSDLMDYLEVSTFLKKLMSSLSSNQHPQNSMKHVSFCHRCISAGALRQDWAISHWCCNLNEQFVCISACIQQILACAYIYPMRGCIWMYIPIHFWPS